MAGIWQMGEVTSPNVWDMGEEGAVASTSITSVGGDNSFPYNATGIIILGSGFEAAQGTGSVDIGGVSQTVTAWSATSITIDVVLGGNTIDSHILTVTPDTNPSATISIALEAPTNHGAVYSSSPITDNAASVFYNTVPAVINGDQFEWNDLNALGNLTIGANGLITNVDTEGSFEGRVWDATDSTWGSWATFNAAVPNVVGPVVTSVSAPASNTYVEFDNINIPVNWDEPAYVVGTPQLSITVGANAEFAYYVSGSGTTTHIYRYTVQAGALDTNGISVNSLTLNGGTIRDIYDNDATLTLNNVADMSGVLVDAVPPVVTVNDLITSDTTPVISGTCDDDSATLDVVVNAVTYHPTPSGGAWSQQLPELAIGSYPMTIDAVDPAGNAATQDTGTLQIIEPSTAYVGTKGNMNKLRLMYAEEGVDSGSINLREIKYWQAKGATSSQYNQAKKEAGEL